MKCEYCDEEGNVNATMPTGAGIFHGILCIKHSLELHDNPEILFKIIKQRAEKMNIKLPTDEIAKMEEILNAKAN
jgi:hypothetical protein